ncbi:hypothetical protein [Aestuariimicrobium sp. T2.26MG-19.2B]|uniref:hypothetical protein n=1 Tax=Aestuariimicrobium sp. T2.26MG-19.2B TaxID=3040679 RepID=UPI0025408442|nr:hypothetical protein [Aestuariimicrobium sp. T2.26MG-19.2B]
MSQTNQPPQNQWRPPTGPQGSPPPGQAPGAFHQTNPYQRPLPPAPPPTPGSIPLGRQRPESVSIDQFREPRSRAVWCVAAAVAVVVAGLVAAAFSVGRPPQAVTTPSPTPPVSSPQGPTAASSNGVPFHSERDNADGYWTITSQRWSSSGLELTMELTITSGTMDYSFFALDNATTQDYDPAPGSTETLSHGTASEGEKVTGVVIFDKPQSDTTVYLAGSGRQVTALVVRG